MSTLPVDIDALEMVRAVAEAAVVLGDVDAAFSAYDALLAADPHDRDALAGTANVVLALGDPEEACRLLEFACDHHRDDPRLLEQLGTTAIAAGRGRLAVEAFEQRQQVGESDAPLHLALTIASYLDLELDRARDHAELALREDSASEEARWWRDHLDGIVTRHELLIDVGRYLCRQGNLRHGADLLEQALEGGADPVAHRALGTALILMDRADEGLAHLEQAQTALPDDPETLLARADALAILDRAADALAVYSHVLEVRPDQPEALVGRGRLALVADDAESALADADAAIAAARETIDAWALRAQALVRGDHYERARAAADHAISLDVERPSSWVVGETVVEMGAGPAALYRRHAALLASRGAAPPDADADARRLGDVDDELTAMALLVAEHPDSGHVYQDRATVYAALGESARALAVLEAGRRAGKIDEDGPELVRHGLLLLDVERPSEAVDVLERALAVEPDNETALAALALARSAGPSRIGESSLWVATHVVPAAGLPVWEAPDPAAAPIATLDPGLEVALVEERGGWASVRCSNGWGGWTDGSRLQVAVAESATPEVPWVPTHVVPADGLPVWEAPDPSAAPIATLGPGLEVALVEERGGWASVRCSNGWGGWTDSGRLRPR